MTASEDDTPTQHLPPRWVGQAPLPPESAGRTRRRRFDDTLDLPAQERPPEIRYVEIPVYRDVPVYVEPQRPPHVDPTRRAPAHEPTRQAPVPAPVHGPTRHAPRVEPARREKTPRRSRRQEPLPSYPGHPGGGTSRPLPPPRRRRRRKWPWVFLFMLLSCAGCCGGGYLFAKPFYEQYPAAVSADAQVTGLNPTADPTASRVADRLGQALASNQWDEQRHTLVYADPAAGGRRVAVAVTSRFVTDPKADLDAAVGKLADQFGLTNVRVVDPGSLGGEVRCASGRADGRGIMLCAWADHGTMGAAVFPTTALEANAAKLATLRESLVNRGTWF